MGEFNNNNLIEEFELLLTDNRKPLYEYYLQFYDQGGNRIYTGVMIGEILTFPETLVIPATLIIPNRGELPVVQLGSGSKLFWDSNFENPKSVIIPSSVTKIGYRAFEYSKVSTITFEQNSQLKIIEEIAFNNSNIVNIKLPDSITYIGKNAFLNCKKLRTINIPNNYTFISPDWLSGCELLYININTIPVSQRNIVPAFVFTSLLERNMGRFEYTENSDKTITIINLNQVTRIGSGYDTLKDIYIPKSLDLKTVTKIGWGLASYGNIILISIPESVTHIDSMAFQFSNLEVIVFEGNSNLRSIYSGVIEGISPNLRIYYANNKDKIKSLLPITFKNLYYIGSNASFNNNNISQIYKEGCESEIIMGTVSIIRHKRWLQVFTNIVIPNTIDNYPVTRILNNAFDETLKWDISNEYTGIHPNDCIRSIILPNSLLSIGIRAFASTDFLTNMIIPDSCIFIDEYAFVNSKIKNITLSNNITNISNNLFQNSKIEKIELNQKVTSIGPYAFDNCVNLTSIILQDSITSIGSNAFSNCVTLKSINIPNRITSIENSAFLNCNGLTSITMSNTVKSIGIESFSKCNSLTSITLSNTLTNIGVNAFSNCNSLTSITIPNTVTNIGLNAFSNCINLDLIIISNGLRNIHTNAFANTLMSYIVIPESVTKIETNAFLNCPNLVTIRFEGVISEFGLNAFTNISPSIRVFHYNTWTPTTKTLFRNSTNSILIDYINRGVKKQVLPP
jgi:hypothetical protein